MNGEKSLMNYPRLSLVDSYDDNRCEFSKDYAQSMTPLVIGEYARLGLDDAFLPILGRHIDDLHLTRSDREKSSLMVLPDNSTNECNFVRVANIADGQLKEYFSRLEVAVQRVGCDVTNRTRFEDYDDNKATLTCAVEWVFAELVVDAVNNSCRMQEVFDGYVPDYNGQANCNLAETTISRNFFNIYGGTEFLKEECIRQDADNFRAGMALLFLRNSLIKHRVTDSVRRAAWIINDLRNDYPCTTHKYVIEPMNVKDIESRLMAMKPNDTKAKMARFIATLDPLEDFLTD